MQLIDCGEANQKNRKISDQIKNLTAFYELQPEQWNEINQYFNLFQTSTVKPQKSMSIRDIVLESWIRSKNNNIPVNHPVKQLDSARFNKILKDNRLLRETALPLIKESLSFLSLNYYFSFSFFDRNGIKLYGVNNYANYLAQPGMDLSEESVGTSSLSLCLQLGKPFYTIAPEIYHDILRTAQVAFSVPIHDMKGRVTAALVIGTCYDYKWLMDNKTLFQSLIALQLSVAERIETGLRLANPSYQIKVAKNPLDAIMTMTDEAFLLINHKGELSQVNQEAETLLGLETKKAIGLHFTEVLGDIPEIPALLGNKVSTKLITRTYTKNGKHYLLKANPILDDAGKNILGVFIRIMNQIKNVVEKPTTSALDPKSIDDIYGKSTIMMETKKMARKIASNRNGVLLTGESGTGKELFAQSIHNESRPDGPFVAINCSSIPRNLIESELFGYEGGSFTGADRKGRPGKFEMADGGTLFLDEIGDMPLELQPVLLRVLESQQVTRIGGNKPIPVNFRIIAATNKDLLEAIKNKEFREDLYFRIAVFKINIPALRFRENDILDLAWYFIQSECDHLGIPVMNMEPAVMKVIEQYNWPGNVRQLKNAMYYAVNMAENGIITLSDLPEEITANTSEDNPSYHLPRSIDQVEQEAIKDAMLYTRNNIFLAASLLDINRSTLYRKLKKYGLSDDIQE